MPDIRLDRVPRGWHTLVNTADRCLTPDGATHAGRIGTITNIEVVNHRIAIETADDTAFNRGVTEAARSLSGEICCICGGKALPVTSGQDEPQRSQCIRDAGQVGTLRVAPRYWTTRDGEKLIGIVEWSAPHAGTLPVERQARWLNHVISGSFDYLTQEWLGIPEGWAGLGRAMLLTLCEEPEKAEPGDSPDGHRWRVHFKEKFGWLQVYGTHGTAFRQGAARLVQELSKQICIRCGMPGAMRRHGFVRPECDTCWQHTGGPTWNNPTVLRTQRELWTAPDAVGV